MNNVSLFQIAAEFRRDAEQLAALDIDEQTLADTLESISGDLTVKAQNVAFVIRNLESMAEQVKQAAAGMTGRAAAMEARAKHIRKYLLDNMQFAGVQKIECPYFQISIRKNPASVVIENERQLPPHYMTTPPQPSPVPDKGAIGEALKAGTNVPGARLSESYRVQIK
jgi:hypothetical protein